MIIINLEFKDGKVRFIDTNLLPNKFKIIETNDPDEIIEAIREMKIRGAPAIGGASALCLALVALYKKYSSKEEIKALIEEYSNKLISARPTAYNMYFAIDKIKNVINNEENLEKIKEKILQEALKICEEDIKANMKIAENGEKLIEDDDIILTHCNTGALATVGIGTALGIIAKAAESKKIQVIVSETRPKLQGSRLTAWELKKLGIPYKIIPDSAVGIVMKKRMVKKVLVGADRIFLSGHVINKIGTLSIALIANYYKIPFYVAAPTSTIDTKNKVEDVKIEERGKEEVIKIKRFYIAPKDAEVLNLAFDITDPELIDAIITEKGIAFRPVNASLVNLLSSS
ncbi:MAG: S-methyl-5-thioribose-1-phosphate isomerase [Thermoproteota archaeon]|nr:S-methyl-5-thioribose-1-phosphate isomerase [Thermoproteota archaeon]